MQNLMALLTVNDEQAKHDISEASSMYSTTKTSKGETAKHVVE